MKTRSHRSGMTDAMAPCAGVVLAATVVLASASFALADPTNTFINTATATAYNNWNLGSNWTLGRPPAGAEVAVITNGLLAQVEDDATTPVYNGGLTLLNGAGLQIGWDAPQEAAELKALGTGPWILHTGSYIWIRYSESSTHANPITLLGDAEFATGKSTAAHNDQRTLTGAISGVGKLTVHTTNGNILHIDPSAPGGNTWSGGLLAGGVHSENKKETIEAEKTGALGTGDVTIDDGVTLQIDAVNAIGDGATLNLAGKPRSDSTYKLVLNADDTIDRLTVDGFPYPGGTYGKIGSGATNEYAWINGNGLLTVTNAPDDVAAPTVTFADDQGGGAVYPGQPVSYTVTFSEPVTPAPTTNDFGNASATGVAVDSVTQTGPVEYRVVARATGTGALQLQLEAGVALVDLFGNAMVTPAADNDILAVQPLPPWKSELGVLKPWANGGINPATGNPWQVGDQYRLAFNTSATRDAASTNIVDYNTFVQGVAAASTAFPELGNGTWKVIGSTAAVAARDNTGTNPNTDGVGVAVILTDGATVFATGNADLWNGSPLRSTGLYMSPYFDENGVEQTTDHSVHTGTQVSGIPEAARVLGGSTETPPKVTTGKIRPNNNGRWLVQFNTAATTALRFFALSDPLTIQAGVPPGTMLIVR